MEYRGEQVVFNDGDSPEERAIHVIPEGYDILEQERDQIDEILDSVDDAAVSEEDKADADEYFGGRPVNMPTRVDGFPDDGTLAARNYKLYATNRGRICAIPSCATRLRYTRSGDLCSIHE